MGLPSIDYDLTWTTCTLQYQCVNMGLKESENWSAKLIAALHIHTHSHTETHTIAPLKTLINLDWF